MKNLYDYIKEGVLDSSNIVTMDVDIKKQQIIDFIRKNYKENNLFGASENIDLSKLEFINKRNKNNKFVVNYHGSVIFDSNNSSLVSDDFVWGTTHNFIILSNNTLKTLDGCPEITESFDCSYSKKLVSLKGCPKKINGTFDCSHNDNLVKLDCKDTIVNNGFVNLECCKKLKDLSDFPSGTITSILLGGCKMIKSLEGLPSNITGSINCTNCINLVTLKGCPIKIGNHIIIDNVKIEDLEYCPQEGVIDIKIISCKKLKSLKGLPKRIKGQFICANNSSLNSIEYIPEYVFSMIFTNNFIEPTENDILKICNVRSNHIRL